MTGSSADVLRWVDRTGAVPRPAYSRRVFASRSWLPESRWSIAQCPARPCTSRRDAHACQHGPRVEHDAQEAGLEKESGDHFQADHHANNGSRGPGKPGPIETELKREDHARNDP